jgi:hypothetical protein
MLQATMLNPTKDPMRYSALQEAFQLQRGIDTWRVHLHFTSRQRLTKCGCSIDQTTPLVIGLSQYASARSCVLASCLLTDAWSMERLSAVLFYITITTVGKCDQSQLSTGARCASRCA